MPVMDSDRTTESQPEQIAVYRNYLRLQAWRLRSLAVPEFQTASGDSLAGRLGLCVGFGLKGMELALATTIAGGAFLGIDLSSERLKAAVRNGSCDFMVNTLDESLRTLKNELRKRTALSVGLLGPASEILPEMVERGVQPDWIADASPNEAAMSDANPTSQKRDVGHPAPGHAEYRQALAQIVERGATMLVADPETRENSAAVEVLWTAANAMDLKRLDNIALERLPEEDSIRRRWLQQAAGCFYRQRPLQRVMGLHPEELPGLTAAFRNAASSGTMEAPASIRWLDTKGVEQTILLQPH